MRAAVIHEFGSIDALATSQLPDPVPAPNQVLIEVRAAPVNYVDLLVIAGKYQFLPQLPFVPGKGPAGVVRAAGAEVAGLSVGDRVLAMVEQGGYAELVLASPNECYRLPDSMPFLDAASMSLAYDTAWFALRDRASIHEGESVLVLGASGAVGLAAIQLAKLMGARVLAGISRAERAAIVLKAGADAVVDLSGEDLLHTLRERVQSANDGKYADVILDPLGGDVFDAALRALAWRGRMVVLGFATGRIPTLKVNYLLLKNIEVSGLQVSDYRKRMPEKMAECYAELFRFFEQGRLKPTDATPYPLDRVVEALASVRDRTKTGRPVLVFPQ